MKQNLLRNVALAIALGSVPAMAAYDGTIQMANPIQVGLGNGSGASGEDSGNGANGGGAFKGTLTSGAGIKTGYTIPGAPVSAALGANDFLSFCIERSETLSQGGSYNFKISDAAKGGGLTGAVAGEDPISLATAWLFSNFVAGTLDNVTSSTFVYDNTGGNQLQNAIWYLEGELPDATLATASWKYLIDAAVGYDANSTSTAAAGAFGVRVMNLYSGAEPGEVRQDQLVVVPEPSTYIAGGLALLPLLFGLRTRFGKK